MPAESTDAKWSTWVGYALSAAPILVLLRSAWMKLSADPQVVQQVVERWGYPASSLAGIGLLELTCVLVYAVPRSTALGAVLLTGYFGGAVATHVRIGEPFWIPLALATFAWAGVYLRDEGVRELARRMARLGRQPLMSTPAATLAPGHLHREIEGGMTARWESWRVMPLVFAAHVKFYRFLGGRIIGRNMLILTTVGRRTGRRRSTLVFFVPDAGDYVVIASNGGEDRYPGWWHNIRANPDVEVETGRKCIACTARRVEDTADADRLFSRLSGVYGGYQEYRQRTKRELTLFRLTPSSGPT